MSSKDSRELARQYESAGYTVEKSGGHNKVLDSDGRFVTTFASTPSSARSSRVDRIRFGQVLAGKPILGRSGTTRREDSQETVAEQAVAEVPAAYRRSDKRAQEAELAAREADILSRAGSLAGIRDIGDLFASVTPAPSIMDRLAFAEKFDQHRRGRAKGKQQKRAGRAWNSVEREAEAIYRAKGFVDPKTDLAHRSGTCVACFQPCDTVFSPSFACAEGHLAFLALLGLPEDQAYVTFRGHWNEVHPLFQLDDGSVPMDWKIAGVQIPTRVCQGCFDHFQKIAWGGKRVRLRDYPGPDGLCGFAYAFEEAQPYEDGPEVLAHYKLVAAACMRVERALVKSRTTGEDGPVSVADIRLMKSVGYQFPPVLDEYL